jgi:signal transduction histidine kinase
MELSTTRSKEVPPLSRRSATGKSARDIQLRERERVGQELHDGLCQSLLGITLELKSMARKAADEHNPYTSSLERAVSLLNSAIEETRDVARGYLPDEMQRHGSLLGALRGLAERTSAKVACEFRSPLEAWIVPREKALQIYRLTQEALANALRHSGARQILVSVEPAEDRVWLRIEDDGNGFTPDATEPYGLGLRIMKRRAVLLGGELEIVSRASVGTSISCAVPRTLDL